MPSADIEALGRAVSRLPESEIPLHPSRNWWCQQVIDHVAERAGELNGDTTDAEHQRQEPRVAPADEDPPHPGLPDQCRNEGNAAEMPPIQTTASGHGPYEGVSCPRCGAEPGAGCQDLRSARTGKRILNFRPHPERVQAAKTKAKLRHMRRSLFARAGQRTEVSLIRGSRTLIMVLLVVLALGAGGCGSSSSSSSSSSGGSGAATTSSATSTHDVGHLPTAKFALHAGLAFGAFHRYIYKPFKAGELHGFSHKLTIFKAGAAGLFAYHELKLAVADAQASPTLSKLLAPVNELADKLKAIGSSVKGGKPDTSSIESANGNITSLSGLAKSAGFSIPTTEPSAAQLAGGG